MRLKINEDIQHCWFGYYLDIKGNKKYFYMTKDSTSKDPDEASEIMENSIPEPFTKFVFSGSVANTQAEKQGWKLVESSTCHKLSENYWIDNKEIMDEVDKLGKELVNNGWNSYADKYTGKAYYWIFVKRENDKAVAKAIIYNHNIKPEVIDITVDQAIGQSSLDSNDALRRKLGSVLLPQNESEADYIPVFGAKAKKDLNEFAYKIDDLKAFYNTSDSIDKNKFPNFFVWYDDMVKSGKLHTESMELNESGRYKGENKFGQNLSQEHLDELKNEPGKVFNFTKFDIFYGENKGHFPFKPCYYVTYRPSNYTSIFLDDEEILRYINANFKESCIKESYIEIDNAVDTIDELGYAGAVEIKDNKVFADETTLRQIIDKLDYTPDIMMTMDEYSKSHAPKNESLSESKNQIMNDKVVDILEKSRYTSFVVDEGDYIKIQGTWRPNSRKCHNDYVDIKSLLDKKLGNGNFDLVYEENTSRDDGNEFSCKLRLRVKKLNESIESKESELITQYLNNGEFDKLEKVHNGTNVIWKLKDTNLKESIEVATIANYITDHYDFDDIDDKYSCINSIKDSFKDEKIISKEELEQFIGSHNGKDKVNESKSINEEKPLSEDSDYDEYDPRNYSNDPYNSNGRLKRNLVIRNGVEEIFGGIFSESPEIESVVLPNTLKTIGPGAFFQCRNLTNINIPNSVTRIETEAFLGCNSLINITIPDNVKYIAPDAFDTNTNLTITCKAGSAAEEYAVKCRINIKYIGKSPFEPNIEDLFNKFYNIIKSKVANMSKYNIVIDGGRLSLGYCLSYYKHASWSPSQTRHGWYKKIFSCYYNKNNGRWKMDLYTYSFGYYENAYIMTNERGYDVCDIKTIEGCGFNEFLKTFRSLDWNYLQPCTQAAKDNCKSQGLNIEWFYPELDAEFGDFNESFKSDNDKYLEESATHCVYFTQDGIDQIEFEGTEDECQDYITKQEADNEFGDEAPERFIKKINEGIDGWDNRTGVIKRIDKYLSSNPEAVPPKGYIAKRTRAYDDIASRYGDYVTTPFGNISTDDLMQYARDNKLLEDSQYQDISNVDLDNELVKDLVVRAFDYNQAQWLVDNDVEYAKHLAYDNVSEDEIAKAEQYLSSKGFAHQYESNLKEDKPIYQSRKYSKKSFDKAYQFLKDATDNFTKEGRFKLPKDISGNACEDILANYYEKSSLIGDSENPTYPEEVMAYNPHNNSINESPELIPIEIVDLENVDEHFSDDIVKELEKYFKENNAAYILDELYYSKPRNVIEFDINNGDWKHEHLWAKRLIQEFFEKLDMDISIESFETQTDGSDCYSAHYTIYPGIKKSYTADIKESAIEEDYTPDMLDDLVNHYAGRTDFATIWDEITNKFNDEDLANDVIEALELQASDLWEKYLTESKELSTDHAIISVVDQVKAVYEAGLFDKLPVGRDRALTLDIFGPDKYRLAGYFNKQPEFNYEMNNENGIISHEFISDKYDIEVFDSFIQMYKIPQNESIAPDGYEPKKKGKAYKVFKVKNGKLYPPMVANPGGEDTPVGVWLTADEGEFAGLSKTGRPQVKSTGSGKLSYRPGWHLGDIPRASQFDRTNKETGEKEFPKDFVWAECEYTMDVDYQPESDEQGYMRTDKNGNQYRSDKYQHSLAGLPKMPKDGYYKYRTNPRPDTVPWVITGAIKVNKLLSDDEVNEILTKHGIEPIHRQGGDKTLAELGL